MTNGSKSPLGTGNWKLATFSHWQQFTRRGLLFRRLEAEEAGGGVAGRWAEVGPLLVGLEPEEAGGGDCAAYAVRVDGSEFGKNRHMQVVSPDDDVVVERDADKFADIAETSRFRDVFLRWIRISARVIVSDNDGYRAKSDGLAEDFTRMEECLIRRAPRYYHGLAKKMPFCIKVKGVGALLCLVDADRSDLSHNIIRRFYRSGKGAMRCLDIATNERKRCGELYGRDLSDAGNLCSYNLLPGCFDES